MSEKENISIFQRPLWVSIFALTAAIVWGWAYPLIKLGFAEFGITQAMTGSKMLFAGIRFAFSGIIILLIALCTGKSFAFKQSQKPTTLASSHFVTVLYILAFSLINTTLHYTFFYIGLSYSQGARAAILNSMSVFAVVIFACIFFKSDKMTMRKVVGCVRNLGTQPWCSRKWFVHAHGRRNDHPQCSVWCHCRTHDTRLEQEGGSVCRHRIQPCGGRGVARHPWASDGRHIAQHHSLGVRHLADAHRNIDLGL